MPTRDLGECLGERPGYRSCGRPEAVVVATVMEVLGQDDQSSAARSGLGRECDGAIDVRLDVTGRVELDEGDGTAWRHRTRWVRRAGRTAPGPAWARESRCRPRVLSRRPGSRRWQSHPCTGRGQHWSPKRSILAARLAALSACLAAWRSAFSCVHPG